MSDAVPLLQTVIPAVPPTLHVRLPFVPTGATLAEPVTATLKVIVEGTDPPPLEVSTTVGATLAMVTKTGVGAIVIGK